MGNKEHPLYLTWNSMRTRCNNPNHAAYHRYGGRGIQVCSEWDDFWQFVADVGDKPSEEYTLDRIDNDGNYEPGNVRWATRKEQSWNSRNSQPCVVKGKEYPSIKEAARAYGIRQSTVDMRINSYGWSLEDAVATPVVRGSNNTPLSKQRRIGSAIFEALRGER